MRWQKRVAFLVALSVVLLGTQSASARSQRNLSYRADQTWTSAVRLLRVDLGFELLERDADAHYVLFRYNDGEATHPGSIEIVERPMDSGITGVTVIVSIPAMPTYVELNLIDRLERKLRDEVGPPIQPPRPVISTGHRPAERQDEEADDEEAGDEDEDDADSND